MGKSGFFPRLALVNLVRNGRYYGPYLLSCGALAAMYYILRFLTWNEVILTVRGSAYLQTMMFIGCVVVGLFSAALLLYANSFVMKRRQRELGLYNILGLEKRHVAVLCVWETLFCAAAAIPGGLAAGILLSKLILLLLLKLVKLPVQFGFSVSVRGMGETAALMGVLFLLALLWNLLRLARGRPIELLHSDSAGEREPKTKRLLAVLGLASLLGGYAIALTTEDPVQALTLFFVAVVLVMLGTYCLFTAGSIALLKRLRESKGFYYQTRHFTAVSGLLYRMKQNAVGLANICILACMVLVTVSGTVCLYLGAEKSLDAYYPYDVEIGGDLTGEGLTGRAEEIRNRIGELAADAGLSVTRMDDTLYLSCAFTMEGDTVRFTENKFIASVSSVVADRLVIFQTAEEYARLTGENVSLAAEEVLCWDPEGILPDSFTLSASGGAYRVAGRLEEMPLSLQSGRFGGYESGVLYLAVADEAALLRIADAQVSERGENASAPLYRANFDLTGSGEEQIAFLHTLTDAWNWTEGGYSYVSRAEAAEEFYTMYGGFLFLGIFLGLLFLLATVLIIYYKQVSEGYEDQRRYRIMQQVGMSRREVSASIRGQILLVFFLPLAAAGLHILAAFPMLCRILELFGLYDVGLFALCTAAALAVFAAVYALVYGLTARTYERIVSSAA
ncbi:MAG: FtsX-like permease family protein [Oscillospiraceae bacterium]